MMARKLALGEKPLHWVGSSLKDVGRFPAEVQRTMGFALSAAQFGGKHPSAKPWRGEGPGILEVVKDYDGDTFRAVYTVRFGDAVYVLHAFQKKSPSGIATRQSDIELVKARLRIAQRDYEDKHG
ncbi:MAG: type II toxin-antitoxin system RelE/ParE family toxin [Terracidiphilus sp.]